MCQHLNTVNVLLWETNSSTLSLRSFAVVLVEIVTRNDPYPDHEAVQVSSLTEP